MKHFIWRNGNKMGNNWRDSTLTAHGAHGGVLIDLRTCEVELLETKVQIQPENHCNEYLPFFISFNIKVCSSHECFCTVTVSHSSRDAELCCGSCCYWHHAPQATAGPELDHFVPVYRGETDWLQKHKHLISHFEQSGLQSAFIPSRMFRIC